MKNPWKTISSQSVYENPWIKVSHHEVITPNQTEGIYGKVHFKNLAIGIIPLLEDMTTWIVGQYRYTLSEYSWEIPMGGGILNVDPLVSAQRELKEETGLIAKDWSCLLKMHLSNSCTDETGYVFLAKDIVESGDTCFDDTEQIEVKKLPLSEVLRMCESGEITDNLSLAGIYKIARKLGL